MFPRSARGRPSRPAAVTQLIADLDLDQENSFSESPHSDSIDHVCSPDLTDPEAYYGQAGTALLCFHDSPTSSVHLEDPRHVISPPNPEATTFLVYQDDYTASNSVSQVATGHQCLIDSGSTLNTVDDATILEDYATPSSSNIKMRSATGQIVRPAGQGNLPFYFNSGHGSLAVPCHHTPDIATIIMSPSETCERVGYDVYTLTCNRKTCVSSLLFTKAGAPDIELLGTYAARLPLNALSLSVLWIWLTSAFLTRRILRCIKF
jgi:hypothetical protein